MQLLSTGTNFLMILFGFGALIFVHELGHFLAARWAGIRVEGFSVGMGPPAFAWRRGIGFVLGSTDPATKSRFGKPAIAMSDEELQRNGIGETEYTLRMLPIGGFVRMLGQEDGNPGAVSASPRSYQTCSIGKRMVVVSAGVIMNLAMAIVLFLIAFAVGVRFPAPIVQGSLADWPAGLAVATNAAEAGLPKDGPAGLQPGDTIVSIDGEAIETFGDVMIAAAMGRLGQALQITVSRPGVTIPLEFSIVPRRDEREGLLKLGIGEGQALSSTITNVPASMQDVRERLMVAGLTQLAPGATLLSLDGAPIATLNEFEDRVARGTGAPIETAWLIPGAADPLRLMLTPQADLAPILTTAGGDLIAWDGLFGMTPLMRVATVLSESPNTGIILPGDVLLRVGDVDAPNFADLRRIAKANAGNKRLPMLVLRDGKEVQIDTTVTAEGTLKFAPSAALDLPIIASPIEVALGALPKDASVDSDRPSIDMPIKGLDLFPRSTILAAGGIQITDWTTFRGALRTSTLTAHTMHTGAAVPIEFALPMGDASAPTTEVKTLVLSADDVKNLHALGWRSPLPFPIFDPAFVTLRATGPVDAVRKGFVQTKKMVIQVYLTIDRLVRGSIGVDKLNGPVGIFHIGVRVADQGFMFLVFFVAMLSVNLAVMNFLPLPIVDGGLFLFLVYEKIVGRPPSITFQNAATVVGLVLIGSIFLITFYNDVARLVQ